jgi:hypothetical protein
MDRDIEKALVIIQDHVVCNRRSATNRLGLLALKCFAEADDVLLECITDLIAVGQPCNSLKASVSKARTVYNYLRSNPIVTGDVIVIWYKDGTSYKSNELHSANILGMDLEKTFTQGRLLVSYLYSIVQGVKHA